MRWTRPVMVLAVGVLGIHSVPAQADQITLDSGALVEGSLAAWQQGGECWIHLSEGVLAGTTLVVDCARVLRFERAPTALVNVPVAPIVADPPTPPAALPVEAVPDALPPVGAPSHSPITELPGARVPVSPIDDIQTQAPAS